MSEIIYLLDKHLISILVFICTLSIIIKIKLHDIVKELLSILSSSANNKLSLNRTIVLVLGVISFALLLNYKEMPTNQIALLTTIITVLATSLTPRNNDKGKK
jgi:hypothetical protein